MENNQMITPIDRIHPPKGNRHMNPSLPKIEPEPSTQLRNAVSRGTHPAIVLVMLIGVLVFIGPAVFGQESALFRGHTLRGIAVAMRKNCSVEEYEKMRAWGGNSLRMVFDAERDKFIEIKKGSMRLRPEGFAAMKTALDRAHEAHLVVVLGMMKYPWRDKPGGLLWSDFKYWNDYLTLWTELAKQFGKHPAVVGYDVMNEADWVLGSSEQSKLQSIIAVGKDWTPPIMWNNTPRDYQLLMKQVTQTIRAVDNHTTIIIQGAGCYGKVYNLRWLTPTGDSNTIYSFHMYQPVEFTHYKKTTALANEEHYAQQSPGIPEYPSKTFGASDVTAYLSIADDFAKRYGVSLYLGEFAPCVYNDGHGSGRWLTDVLTYAEAHHWHWAYWSYSVPDRSPEYGADNLHEPTTTPTERMLVLKQFWKNNL